VVIFTNNSQDAGGIARQIADLYPADQYIEQPPQRTDRPQRQTRPRQRQQSPLQPEPITLSSLQLQEHLRVYYSDELDAYATLSMEQDKDNPVIKLGNISGSLITYSSDNFRWGRRQIEFTRDSRKKITGFILQTGSSYKLDFTRIN